MLPFGLQPIHLIVIAIVALLIFGPQRLPEIGRGVGRAINEFRKGAQEMTENLRDEVVKPTDAAAPAAPPAANPAPAAAAQTCPQCGAQNAAGVRFCNHCGAQLVAAAAPIPVQSAAPQNCPQCGAQNPAGVRFCNQCGTQLAPNQA
jgi:TatA/E family protein of Tat protein translocase